MTGRKTAIVICPARGASHATELSSLSHQFPDSALRQVEGQDRLTALDAAIR